MSNFQFLATEFKPLLYPARGAEQLVYSDTLVCCIRMQHAMEQAGWYEQDRDLRIAYENSLGAQLTQPHSRSLVFDNLESVIPCRSMELPATFSESPRIT